MDAERSAAVPLSSPAAAERGARAPGCVSDMSDSLGVSVQPDGGEALAKRKGRTARDCLKEAWSKVATRRTETGYEAVLVGRAGSHSRSPYPSRARTVNPAGVR